MATEVNEPVVYKIHAHIVPGFVHGQVIIQITEDTKETVFSVPFMQLSGVILWTDQMPTKEMALEKARETMSTHEGAYYVKLNSDEIREKEIDMANSLTEGSTVTITEVTERLTGPLGIWPFPVLNAIIGGR